MNNCLLFASIFIPAFGLGYLTCLMTTVSVRWRGKP